MGFIDRLKRGPVFLKEVWTELKKVTWPTRKELTSYTLVVIVTVVLIAVFFAIIDLGISQLLGLLFKAGK
ncbi:preprotein translocase subunit SecE [Aneurinibacillus tyrosinisolvens]|uniref:preprotein translocase subunit SecE n=1 Tax=Aneurinibacillus tyrosinisolvens TaxID=1443435 RepID=UPI00063EF202|nr:preprotein translocase subunit SecE [Aneurinibacillus tyrosinisolvens]